MDDVQFNEPRSRLPKIHIKRTIFANFLIKTGLAKNKQQATYILLGIIGVGVFIMIMLLINGDDQRNFSKTEIETLEQAGSPSEITEPEF